MIKNIWNKILQKISEFRNLSEKHLGKNLGNIVAIVVIACITFALFLILESIIMSIPVQFWLAAIFVVLLLK